jgi:ABC-2 type transport system permease protein
MGLFRAAFRMQLRAALAQPTFYMVLFTVPPYTVLFLAIVQDAGRTDLVGHAVLAPVLIAVWAFAIWVSGSLVNVDRWLGVLELSVASPASYPTLLMARILALTLISLVAFVEVWFTAWIGFGIAITVPHPAVFLASLLAAIVAMAATAVAMASIFVLSRVANTFQIAVSYPFYVLGGVLVPIELLPGWVQPFTKVIFLSWASDLLRDSLNEGPIDAAWARVGIILVIAAATFALGRVLIDRIIHKIRVTGEISVA